MADQDLQIKIVEFADGKQVEKLDHVAIEEPMEIRLVTGPEDKRRGKSLSITMRTPGNDEELALGFLFTEGILNSFEQIRHVEFCGPIAEGQSAPNTIRVELTYDAEFDPQNLQRHFYTTSSCGVCGKASLDALRQQDMVPLASELELAADTLAQLPEKLRSHQTSFLRTGGIHAAGLFDKHGNLVVLREDVGRHNALDKLIGQRLKENNFSGADGGVLVVSGRASFELLQKSLAARIPIFVAVGAPSSLAVELANAFNITLVGFASQHRFNIYSHPRRIVI